jgi:polyisoprenoid-binding protein YceI
MKSHFLTFILSALFLALAPMGCANPADDTVDAEVGEASGVSDDAVDTAGDEAAMGESMQYTVTEDSKVEWTGSKVTGSHDGTFEDVSGTITVMGGTPEGSKVDVTIDTTTVTSDNDDLTEHLKSADFFDVEQYPEARFVSTSIEPGDDGMYRVTGDLTLHGVTKQITFPADIEVTDSGASASAEFDIRRFDWNINYKGKADDLIRDEVVLRLDLRAE